MICKYCKNEIPDESVFCMICGERVARKKREKKPEIKVPKPRQLADSTWYAQVMVNGKRETVKGATEKEYYAKAEALKAGIAKQKKILPKQDLETILQKYIDDNDGTLSPSTIRGYTSTAKARFINYQKKDVSKINWQAMISEEAKHKSPKTVKNGWGLVTAALAHAGYPVPDVNLPQVPPSDRDFLDYEQIQIFLNAIRGKNCELACLLALHSLRESEIRALTPGSLKDDTILVRGAVVPDKSHKLVKKDTNKSNASRRDVPVMIDRLTEIWPSGDTLNLQSTSCLRRMIQGICEKNDLPVIGIHGLRHSFASLAWHLNWDIMTTCAVGGWSTPETVQKIYTHLAQKDKNKHIRKMQRFYKGKFTKKITNG